MGTGRDEDTYKTAPLPPSRDIVEPGKGGLQIPVDKRKYRVRFVGETESTVDIIIEPKE